MRVLTNRFGKAFLVAACVVGASMGTAQAAEPNVAGTKVKVAPEQGGSTLKIELKDESRFRENAAGGIEVLAADGHVKETLPATAVDSQGELITFRYELRDDRTVEVSKLGASGITTYGWWSDWGKCAAGIGGGAITGAGSLGTAAAGVGLAGGPWGAGAGAIGGGIVGGVGGALTGAAAAC